MLEGTKWKVVQQTFSTVVTKVLDADTLSN